MNDELNLDLPVLDSDRTTLESQLRDVKRRLRSTWTEPMADAQAEQSCLAAQLTALYTLRAWARGRLHRTQAPRDLRDSCRDMGIPLRWDAEEYNRKVAEKIADRYRRTTRARAMRGEDAIPVAS